MVLVTGFKIYETTGVQTDLKVHEIIDIEAANFSAVQIDLTAGDANVVQTDSIALEQFPSRPTVTWVFKRLPPIEFILWLLK